MNYLLNTVLYNDQKKKNYSIQPIGEQFEPNAKSIWKTLIKKIKARTK